MQGFHSARRTRTTKTTCRSDMPSSPADRPRIDLTEPQFCETDPRQGMADVEIRLLEKHTSIRAAQGGYLVSAKARYAGVLRLSTQDYVLPTHFSLLTLVRLILLRHGITDLEQSDLAKLTQRIGSDESDLDKVLSALLILECERISRGHVVQQYLEVRDLLPVARGRPLWMTSKLHPGQVACRYQLKTTDVLLNQLLSAGLDAARWHLRTEPTLRTRVNSQAFVWADIASPNRPRYHDFDTARARLNRLGEHYRTALALAQALLFKVDEDGDSNPILSPVSDLAYLFETLIERALDICHPTDITVIHQDQGTRSIVNVDGRTYRRTRPDISLIQGGKTRLVVDAKYKPRYASGGPGLTSQSRVDVADLYQMFFYSERAARAQGSDDPVPVAIVAPLLPGATPPTERLLRVYWQDAKTPARPPLTIVPIPVEELTRAVSTSNYESVSSIMSPVLALLA